MKGLTAASRLSERTGHPGWDIKPCIAALTETPLRKGDFPNRHEAAVAIASEHRRIGTEYDYAFRLLELWNQHNSPPMRHNDLLRAAGNGYGKDYNYSCRHRVLEAYCIGHDDCPFRTKVISKKSKLNDLVFIDYHWPEFLSNRQVLIYSVALPYLEKTRRIGRGGLICANHQQIADACGVARERTGKDLQALSEAGLIEYNVGSPRIWEGKASEIRRVFPIPRPTRTIIQHLKNRKTSHGKVDICHNIERVSNPIRIEDETNE